MYKKILLPLDIANERSQRKAVKTAIQLAQAYSSVLHVISVVPDFGMSMVGTYFPADYEKKMIQDTKQKLENYVAKNIPDTIKTRLIVAHGNIYTEILDYANKTKVNLIVMASHRPELKDYLIGPNASKIVRHANCSAMVVRT